MSLRVLTAVAAAAVIGLMSVPASAKTKAECTKEWQSQKAAMQAAGTKEKDYVKQCRAASATPASAPASAPAAKPASNKGPGTY